MARVYKDTLNGKKCYFGDYVDATGKRVRKWLAFTKEEADRLLSEIRESEREKELGNGVTLEPISFAAMCVKFMDAKAKEKLSPKSLKRLRTSIKHLIGEYGDLDVRGINPVLVGRYKEKRVRVVDGSTVNRELACLSHMFTKAIEWGHARENPVSRVKKFTEHYDVDRSLPSAKLNALLDACPPYMYWLVLFAICTGLRAGEILSLRFSMLDEGLAVKNRKWRVSLSAPLGKLAKAILAQVPRYPGCDYVFPDEYGKPFVTYVKGEKFIRRVFNLRWSQVVQKAGISEDEKDKFRFHDLRHTTGTWLAKLSFNAFQIQGIMGIKNIRTAQRYVHLSGVDLEKPVNGLSDYVASLVGETPVALDKPDSFLTVVASVDSLTPGRSVQGSPELKPDEVGTQLAETKEAV